MLGMINILNKIYNKKVTLNVINLKYLYLDNYIFTEAIVRKLNDRKKRILKVLRKAIKFAKITKLHHSILTSKNSIRLKFKNIIKNSLYKNIFTYVNNNHNIVLENLKYKYLTGINVQGSGRLTKRLTASRTILKHSHKGTLKNINSSVQQIPAVLLKGYSKSNIKYININSKNRNGSFGIKS
jgi:hypothetical protein